jgi:ABC-type lipoprotein release transport system permease subunit
MLAQKLFGAGFSDGLVRLSSGNVVSVIVAVLMLVTLASLFAARSITRVDPAIVLRESV